jgi:tetratricopeptide (TPR) repeat protein
VAEDIRALSAQLARDPASLAYAELAEALRRRGQREEAERVAMNGLSRHPKHADGYDCLARVYADRGELGKARLAWERALEIEPEHVGALKGIGFLFYRQGDVKRARDALEHALAANPADDSVRRALASMSGTAAMPAPAAAAVTPPAGPPVAEPLLQAPPVAAVPSAGAEGDPAVAARPPVFAGLEGATADILLLDSRGLVLAGGLRAADGRDASELAAAALAGVSGEASRTAGYLDLGGWTTIVAEAETAHMVLAPVGDGALLMVRRDRSVPVGLALRFAERARGAAHAWLEGQGA